MLAAAGVLAAAGFAAGLPARRQLVAGAVVLGLLLVAPAAWAVQTLGHATNGTFPAGGPVSAGLDRGGSRGGFGGPPGGAGGPGGGMFGGDSGSLAPAVAYTRAHGGGTIAVSSQSGAAGELIATRADLAGIGGFSGRESQVSLAWLADAVQSGEIRWAVTDGSFAGRQDGRVGAQDVMAAIRQVGTPVGGQAFPCRILARLRLLKAPIS